METESPFRFGLVLHSSEVVDAVRACSKEDSDELIVRLVDLDQAVPTALRMLEEGAEVIVGHGGTGSVLTQKIGHRVVNIPRTHMDIIHAVQKARPHGREMAITCYASPSEGIDLLETLLDVRIHQIVFHSTEELRSGVHKALADGIGVILGGGVSRRMASRANGHSVIIAPNPLMIRQALVQARAMALAHRLEKEQTEQFRSILNILDEGVVGVDSFGRINFCNPTAAQILGVDPASLGGQSLSHLTQQLGLLEVLTAETPQTDKIRTIRERNLVINTLPIRMDSQTRGAVALFKEAAVIQNTDRKLRETLYLKGFAAHHRLEDLIGDSPAMRTLRRKARRYAGTGAPVLILGDTGTGKELLAHAVHLASPRAEYPFVAINCAALPETLLESELFGYEEGAFTGARRGGKIGLFELASSGTLFLDEIADIPASLQIRLLRVLETQEVMRVGGDKIVPVDVRVISATAKELCREVQQNRFRLDLYFRIAGLTLTLPPLRARTDDIAAIVAGFLAEHNRPAGCFSAAMLAELQRYPWPGNIRELKSLLQNYLSLLGKEDCDEGLVRELLAEHRTAALVLQGGRTEGTLQEQLAEYRRTIIRRTLRECQFNRSLTARRLGINPNTVWRTLKSDPNGGPDGARENT